MRPHFPSLPSLLLLVSHVFSPLFDQAVYSQQLLVAAASDLSPLEQSLTQLPSIAVAVRPTFTFGSSGMLKRQIENGAPYDVYLSASEEFVRDLANAGRVLPASVSVYATGRLALWSSAGRLKAPLDLLRPEVRRIAIPNPRHAPYGLAAEELLENLGLLARIREKIVYGENVRQAFEFARTGNVDAVISSWTLLKDRKAVLLSEKDHRPIRQAAGVVASTPHIPEAQRFLGWLLSSEGQAVLREGGLFPPDSGKGSGRP